MTVLAAVGGTAAMYVGGLALQRALGGHPLANPTLIAIVGVAVVLRLSGIDAHAYARAAWPLVALLAPATVALGVPLAANLPAIRRRAARIVIGTVAGAAGTGIVAVLILKACGAAPGLARAMLPKSATTPIAMEVAGRIGGDPSLAATFAIAGGLLTALLLRPLIATFRLDEAAAGLAAGVGGSGIGAAAAARLSERAAAFAAMGVGLAGLATALLAPLLRRVLHLG